MSNNPKTLVGVLASHDSPEKNEALAKVLRAAYGSARIRNVMRKYRFVFTAGTYDRLFNGKPAQGQNSTVKHGLDTRIVRFLHNDCGVVKVPPKDAGGVTVLACLVTQRKVSILWPFFSALTTHLLYPENLALLRLADQWHVKKLMNSGSAKEWLACEAERDSRLNLQDDPFSVNLPSGTTLTARLAAPGSRGFSLVARRGPKPPRREEWCKQVRFTDRHLAQTTIALISHDEMKQRMVDFAIDYEHELAKFGSILATGTTGRLIQDAAPRLASKVHLYHSGPKGGDIEIATEVLYGRCHVVVFFVDPLHPHPHIEDIRVVFGACMIEDSIPMVSNEVQARAWMDQRVRGA